jgi:hypothetical protein
MFSYDPYAALAELRPVPPLELTSPDFTAGGAAPHGLDAEADLDQHRLHR